MMITKISLKVDTSKILEQELMRVYGQKILSDRARAVLLKKRKKNSQVMTINKRDQDKKIKQ